MTQHLLKSARLISEQICDHYRRNIEKGKFSPDQPLPSYGTLAEHYGISKSTVHEAFKKLAAEQYLFIKQGKGAFVNPAKIHSRAAHVLTDVAVITFNIFSANDNYMIPFLEAINGQAEKAAIHLHFQFIQGMSIFEPGNEMLKDALADGRYQGALLASPLDVKDLDWLSALKIPVVAATSHYGLNVAQVTPDNALAVSLAAEQFARFSVRRAAVFTGPLSWEREGIVPFAREIYDAFHKLEMDRTFKVDYIPCEYNYLDAKKKACQCLIGNHHYQGVFCQSDIIARGVMAAFHENSIPVRKKVLINYCDLEDYLMPDNIIKPLAQIGKQAFAMLKRQAEDPGAPVTAVRVKPVSKFEKFTCSKEAMS